MARRPADRVVVRASGGVRVRTSRLVRTSIEDLKAFARKKGGRCLSPHYVVLGRFDWECARGHRFEMLWVTVQNGSWCQECPREDKLEALRALVKKRHRGECLSEDYPEQHGKATFRCERGHVWRSKPADVRTGYWCRTCHYESTRLTIAEMQRDAVARGGRLLSNRWTPQTKLRWMCAKGHRFLAEPYGVRLGNWCPECSPTRWKTIEEMRDLARERAGRCLSEEYGGIRFPLEWECAKRHVWSATPDSARKYWCSRCHRHRTRYSVADFVRAATSRGGRYLDVEYVPGIKGAFECGQGHRFDASPLLVLAGQWCPSCARRRYSLDEMIEIARSRGGRCLSKSVSGFDAVLEWECAERHRWSARAIAVKHGTWCRICAGVTRWTVAELQEIARSRGGRCHATSMRNNKEMLGWSCDRGHRWHAPVTSVACATSWCARCDRDADRDRLMRHVAKFRRGRFVDRYVNKDTMMRWSCRRGHAFRLSARQALRLSWCSRCPPTATRGVERAAR